MPDPIPRAAKRPHDRERDAARAAQIVARLERSDSGSSEVYEAFGDLDALPADVVRDALAAWLGPQPDLARMDDATRVAQGLPRRPLRLRTTAIATDADVLDLGPLAEEQLRLAGKSWDGADLAAEERLDGELEGSFAGTLVRRVLADEDAPEIPRFDVLLFAEDSGIVFAAGTTKQVALITYGKVEMRDARTRTAIEAALEGAPAAIAPVAAATKSKAKTKGSRTATAKTTAKSKAKAATKPKKTTAAKKKTATKTAKAKAKAKTAAKRTRRG